MISPSDWIIIGPFENIKGKGFDTVCPPEREIQLDAFYFGKWGRKVNWQRLYWMDGEIGEHLVLSRLFLQHDRQRRDIGADYSRAYKHFWNFTQNS